MPLSAKLSFNQKIVRRILAAVERAFKVDQADILGEHRKADMVEARHVAVWLMRELTDAQHADIAVSLNRQTHVMSVQGFWRVQERRKRDPEFRTLTDRLARELSKDLGVRPRKAN